MTFRRISNFLSGEAREVFVKTRYKFLLKVLISIALVGYLSTKIEWPVLGQTMRSMRPGLYILSFLFSLSTTLFLAAKCTLLLRGSPITHSFAVLLRINIIARFYAVFLPPILGPEMVRWYKITKNQSGKTFFMAATLFERVGFLLVSVLISFLFLFFSPSSRVIAPLRDKILPLLLVPILAALIIKIFLLSSAAHGIGRRILSLVVPPMRNKERLMEMYEEFFLTNRSAELVAGVTALSIGWHAFFLIGNYLVFLSVSIPLGFMDVAWISSLVFLVQILPVSLGGIGIREGAYAYIFMRMDLPPEQGVAVALLISSQFLLLAAIGGILELLVPQEVSKK